MRSVRLLLIVFVLVSGWLTVIRPALASSVIDCDDVDISETLHGTFDTFFIHTNNSQTRMKAGQVFRFKASLVSGDGSLVDVVFSEGNQATHYSLPANLSFKAPSDGVYSINGGTLNNPNGATVHLSWHCGSGDSDSAAGKPCDNVSDGRINDDPGLDCAAPIAIYNGSVDVYGINPANGDGTLVMRVGDAAIKASHNPAGGNVLLDSGVIAATGEPVSVYWLTTNEIEVITAYADGKPYEVVWPVDHPEQFYHLAA